MEELEDDDFNDLYAEVEVQASSAIGAMHGLTEMPLGHHGCFGNAIDGFPQLPGDDDELSGNVQNATGGEEVKNGFSEIESEAGNAGVYEETTEYADVEEEEEEEEESDGALTKSPIENGVCYESDSEDDINIVLDGGNHGDRQQNEDCYGNSNSNNRYNRKESGAYEKKDGGRIYGDNKCFTSGDYDSQRKNMGSRSVPPSSNMKGNDPTRSDWEDNGGGQLINEIPVVGQSVSSFALPRSRTILDVNIDPLERHSWRRPRSDVTERFNFGFDEDGWRHYCNDMDKYQGRKLTANRILASEFPRRIKKYGVGYDEDTPPSYAKNTANCTQWKRESSTSKNFHGYHLSELPRGASISENYVGRHQPSSHERHLVDQDSDVGIQDLKDDSRNSNKKTADHIVSQVQEPSKKVDSDVDADRDLPRRNEDQRIKFASERRARHTPIHIPVSLDLDEYGTVQISDSEEENHHEVFDYYLGGVAQTSDDMKRKNASNMSRKVSSAVEPESSQSGRSLHGPGFSCSPTSRAACCNNDRKESREQSKKNSSSRLQDLRGSAISDYHPSRESKHHGVKLNTRDSDYRERDRGPTRKDFKPFKRGHYLKTHLNDEDAPDMLDRRGLYDMYKSMTSRQKKREIPNFDFNGKDVPYHKGSESMFTYSRGSFPDRQWWPAYSKDRYWDIHFRFRCEATCGDDHSMTRKGNSFEKKSRMEYEASKDDWFLNEKRRAIQDTNPIICKDSTKFLQKYSADQKMHQFSRRGDGLQFRRKARRYDVSPPREYNNNIKGRHGKYALSSDRDSCHLDHISDCNMLRDRREIESPARGKGRHTSPRSNSDYSWHIKKDETMRCVKNWPLPFYSYEERHAPGGGQFHGATATKFLYPEKHLRSSWKDRHRETGQCGSNNDFFDPSDGLRCDHGEDHHYRRRRYQQSTDTANNNEYIQNYHDWDHFVSRRNREHSKVLHWSQEEYKCRLPVDTMFNYERPSYHFKRTSRNSRPEDSCLSDHIAECIDEREVDRCRNKIIREGNCNNKFDQSLKITPDSHVQVHRRNKDSVDSKLVVVGKKSSKRTSEAEDAVDYGPYDSMVWNIDQQSQDIEDLNDFDPGKVVLHREGNVEHRHCNKNWHKNFADSQQNEFLDVEEGQIISKEISEKTGECLVTPQVAKLINEVEHPETASNENRVVEGLDDQRIQEIKAKMERRRERFKDPLTLKKASEKSSDCLADLDVETAECKIERPVRKRRWVGS